MKTKIFRSRITVFIFIAVIGLFLAFANGHKSNASGLAPTKVYGVTISGMNNINPNATGIVQLKYSDGTVTQQTFVYGVDTYYNFVYMPTESHTVCASLILNPRPICPAIGTCLEDRTRATNPVGTAFLNVSVRCDED